jgi:hypothetical protein
MPVILSVAKDPAGFPLAGMTLDVIPALLG